jgi:hypothetical protein
VINDAVSLASEFSTDKSPGFVNALLDRAHQTLAAAAATKAGPQDQHASQPPTQASEPSGEDAGAAG